METLSNAANAENNMFEIYYEFGPTDGSAKQ